MGKIHELPKSSSCLLTSSQIITSVFCVVKELIENSLDGDSKNIEVKLEDYGLEKIEVKDNGSGIDKNDIQFVAKPHFTSKISAYSDLERVSSYGFRGEALGAICAVADLLITSKTTEEAIGCMASFTHDGQVNSTKPCPCPQGSTVSVQNLFKNIPVRRQYYRAEKNKRDELRKVEELLVAYSCIQYDVRFVLYHNKNLIYQKPALSCTKNSLIHVLGNSVAHHLKYIDYFDEQNQRKIEMYLPSSDAPQTCGLTTSSRCITAINKRPVRMKQVDKLLKEYYNKAIQNAGKARYPICFISLTLPLAEVDVNLEPNKTNVMVHHSEEILAQFSEMLNSFYDAVDSNQTSLVDDPVPVQEKKSSSEDFLNNLQLKCDAKFQQTKLSYHPESPVPTVNDNVNNRISSLGKNRVDIISNNSLKRTETSITKRDVTILNAKEPSKKKQKCVHASKNDVIEHLNSLKKFFTQESTTGDELTQNSIESMATVPTVTVERPKDSIFEDKQLESISTCDRIPTFAVSTNMCENVPGESHFFPSRKHDLSESSFLSEINLGADVSKRAAVDDSHIQDADAWSRGIHPSGGLFQPVKVLHPQRNNVSESISLKHLDVDRASGKSEPNQKNSSPESVPGKHSKIANGAKSDQEQANVTFERKLTPFDIFCRNNRLEISVQHPEFSVPQITQILCKKWGRLSPEERAVYKSMQDKNYRQEVKKKERLSTLVSQKLSQEKGSTPQKSQIMATASPKKQRTKKIKLKNKPVFFNFESVKESYLEKVRQLLLQETPSSDTLNIISHLEDACAPGTWVCSKNTKLYILNTFRVQETVIYRRMLETFQFETQALDTPVNITINDVGGEAMEILKDLAGVEMNSSKIINDERLVSNGFVIKVVRGMQDQIAFGLIGITNSIDFYGLADLKEFLLLTKTKGLSSNLSECRPQKIISYFQREANRMSRNCPAYQRVQDVQDLLEENDLLNNCQECFHHRPFFTELWDFAKT